MPDLDRAAADSRPVVVHAGTSDAVKRAVDALLDGSIVSLPTDTVYGLAAAIDHPDAIARLYVVKGRPESKPIPVLLSSALELGSVALTVDPFVAAIAAEYWPGPLTIVVSARPGLPEFVTGGAERSRTVAVRVPDHPVARAIIAGAGGAIAVTSANLSGRPPALTAAEVAAQLGGRVDLIVDGGRAPGGVASTVVELRHDGPVVLREGNVSAAELWRRWRSLVNPGGMSTS